MNQRSRATQGFTLIELIVVIGIIAGLSVFLIGGLKENKASALRSGQATIANLLTAARTKAMATGCRVRILIHADPRNPQRFRRLLVVQQETTYKSDNWAIPDNIVSLPEDVVVLPYKGRIPAGIYEFPASWTKTYQVSTGNELHSSILSEDPVSVTIQASASEKWDVIQFTPTDGLSSGHGGDLVLASSVKRRPDEFVVGDSPVRAVSPDAVRGVSISRYGVIALIDSRSGF